MRFAYRAGCKNQKEYASLRLKELRDAFSICDFNREDHILLNGVDQKVIDSLYSLTVQVIHLIERIRPSVVLTHSYEGGHPDHDCASFIVSKALKVFTLSRGHTNIRHFEFSGYHEHNSLIETGTFKTGSGTVITVSLPEYNKNLKKMMIDCFVSQKEMLSIFNIEKEVFRIAPVYDFSRPPHSGKLLYEIMDWGLNSSKWRAVVEQVSQEIDRNFCMP